MNPITPLLMTDLILNCLWQAGCLTLVTLVVVLATRRLQFAMCKLILNLVLLSWLILPIWNFVAVPMDINLRQLSLGGEAEPVPAPMVPLIQPEILTVEPTMVADVVIPEGTFERAGSESFFPTTALNVIGLVWVVGILIGLAKLLFDQIALSRLLRNMEPVADARVLSLWSNFLGEKAKSRVPGLFLTDLVETPFSTGCFRARIVLPVCALEHWSDEEIVAVMSHEFAHWQQRDLISCRLQRVAQVIYWWNPAITFLNRRLNHLQEVICDTITVNSVSSQRDYAQLLIKIAENLGGASCVPSGAVGMARNISSLEQRIQTITNKETNMKSIQMKRRNVVLACSTACCLALPILGVQLTHAAADSSGEIREIDANTFEFDVEPKKTRTGKNKTDAIAEIMIKEDGVTRMIRVPWNDDVRNSRIEDIISKLDDKKTRSDFHWTEEKKTSAGSAPRDVDRKDHDVNVFSFSTAGDDAVIVGESGYRDGDNHAVRTTSRVFVIKKSDDNPFADEEVEFKRGTAHVRIAGSPDREVVELRSVRRDSEEKPLDHLAEIDDLSVFIPEDVEVKVRRQIARSRDQAKRAEVQAEVAVKKHLAALQDKQLEQQREMQSVMREQQRRMEDMMKMWEIRMDELKEENEKMRMRLKVSSDPFSDGFSK